MKRSRPQCLRTDLRTMAWALAAAAALLSAPPASAQTAPSLLEYHGEVLDFGGQPVSETLNFTFRLYHQAAVGEPFWTEVHDAVLVSNGRFDAVLGLTQPLDVAELDPDPDSATGRQRDVWLGISINELAEGRPRQRLLGVAYSFRCISSESLGGAAIFGGTGSSGELLLQQGPIPAEFVLGDVNEAQNATALEGATTADLEESQELIDAIANLPGRPTTVDGLSGGTILSSVAVEGNVPVRGALTIAGHPVCTTAGNCGPTLDDLSCPVGQVLVANSTGSFSCALPPVAPDQLCDNFLQVVQWDGQDWQCANVRAMGPSDGRANGYELVDAWGFGWDGLMRVAQSWSAAMAECTAVGARLPTATELFRVNAATGTGQVADLNATTPLWAHTPNDTGKHVLVRLNDGQTSDALDTDARSFRCVWPDQSYGTFAGNACNGPPGAPCFTLTTEGALLDMDRLDRPALNYNAAVRECAFYHAHLAGERTYAEAIRNGLDNGTGNWLHTADQRGFDSTALNQAVGLVRWTGQAPDFTDFAPDPSGWGVLALNAPRNFRCVGVSAALGVHPNAAPDQWSNATTFLKSNSVDRPPANFLTAVDSCLQQGGHLPTHRDMMELIQSGLPGGTASWLWTADYEGGTDVGTVSWIGVALDFNGYFPVQSQKANRNGTAASAYRCVYYPLDPNYNGPTECNGSCFVNVFDGSVRDVLTWADSFDRPPNTYDQAVQTCYGVGGHLASKRDLVELIRRGLPNGQYASEGNPVWVWSSDTTGASSAAVARWSGTATAYPDVNASDATDVARNASSLLPFRCVWTNEIRYP